MLWFVECLNPATRLKSSSPPCGEILYCMETRINGTCGGIFGFNVALFRRRYMYRHTSDISTPTSYHTVAYTSVVMLIWSGWKEYVDGNKQLKTSLPVKRCHSFTNPPTSNFQAGHQNLHFHHFTFSK